MRKNGSLPEWIVIAVLLLLVLDVVAQTTAKPRPHARIAGPVLDGRGHELNRISVHVVSEKTRIYMPTVISNETGHFVVENLEPGTYNIFGESDAAAYPNTALPFYRSANPSRQQSETMATQMSF